MLIYFVTHCRCDFGIFELHTNLTNTLTNVKYNFKLMARLDMNQIR